MDFNDTHPLSNFFVVGINYKKTDASTRGEFAINNQQYETILQQASLQSLNALFILSTCNRTEIYGFAKDAAQLIALLCSQTVGNANRFTALAYIKNDVDAIAHLFAVGAGLDSQILGDYEIIGQLKQAVRFSKERNFINGFLERLINDVLQASKAIKNETCLSSGSVSVSFAAVQYIRNNVAINADKKILVIGTGKIGSNTCKNLVDYLGTSNITLINRSDDKAAALANELNLQYAPFSELHKFIESSNIILVATNATEPIILSSLITSNDEKLIIDLSIPYNVEAALQNRPNITLVNVDDLSKIKDETLKKREAECPKARIIINKYQRIFIDWYYMRKNAPALTAVKTKLKEIYLQQIPANNSTIYPIVITEQKIQRVVNGIAHQMRNSNHWGCLYLAGINEIVSFAN